MATPIATPPTGSAPPQRAADTAAGDRRLHLEDILRLMVAEGIVSATDADRLARSRTKLFEHPLEMIADQKWKSGTPPHKTLSLEWLGGWLPGGARAARPAP